MIAVVLALALQDPPPPPQPVPLIWKAKKGDHLLSTWKRTMSRKDPKKEGQFAVDDVEITDIEVEWTAADDIDGKGTFDGIITKATVIVGSPKYEVKLAFKKGEPPKETVKVKPKDDFAKANAEKDARAVVERLKAEFADAYTYTVGDETTGTRIASKGGTNAFARAFLPPTPPKEGLKLKEGVKFGPLSLPQEARALASGDKAPTLALTAVTETEAALSAKFAGDLPPRHSFSGVEAKESHRCDLSVRVTFDRTGRLASTKVTYKEIDKVSSKEDFYKSDETLDVTDEWTFKTP